MLAMSEGTSEPEGGRGRAGARPPGTGGASGASEERAGSLADLEVVGPVVALRPQLPADAAAAFRLLHRREEILAWLLWEGPASRAELAVQFERWCVPGADATDLYLSIVERDGGTLLGQMVLRFSGHPPSADVGYWIGTPYQRRGHATEALGLAAHLAFESLGARCLCAWVFVGNQASRRALERNGFELVHTAHGQSMKRGNPVDEWYFVLLRDDWERRSRTRPEHVRVVRAERLGTEGER